MDKPLCIDNDPPGGAGVKHAWKNGGLDIATRGPERLVSVRTCVWCGKRTEKTYTGR